MFLGYVADSQCQVIESFGDNERRGHVFGNVLEGHGVVSGVGDDDGCFRDLRNHPATNHVALEFAQSRLDLRIAFEVFLLLFDLLLGHHQLLERLATLSVEVEGAEKQKDDGGFDKQLAEYVSHERHTGGDRHLGEFE